MNNLLVILLTLGCSSTFAYANQCKVKLHLSNLALYPDASNKQFLMKQESDLRDALLKKGYDVVRKDSDEVADYRFSQEYQGTTYNTSSYFKTRFQSNDIVHDEKAIDINFETETNTFVGTLISNRKNISKRSIRKILRRIPKCF